MTKVALSGSARVYFRQETAYLRQRSPSAAEAFRSRILAALKTLASFPRVGFSHDGLPVPGVSRLIVGDYLLDYETNEDRILILSIRHGRQAPADKPDGNDLDYEAPNGAS